MNRARLVIAACAWALPAAGMSPSYAQGPPVHAAAGATWQAYTFASADDVALESITLLTVPLAVLAPLHRSLELRVAAAFARGTLTRPGAAPSELAGLTDSEVRLTWSTPGDRFRLAAVALVPTGQTELDAEQMSLTGVMAAELMPFAITNWGTGGGIGASAAAAVPLAPGTSFGVSAGYVAAREFEPVADASFAYRPGDQLHVRAAIDRTFGSAGKGSLQVSWQKHGVDEAAGDNLYQAGDRLQARASYAFAAGPRSTGIVWAGWLRRQGGSYTEIVRVTPAQDLIQAGAGFRTSAGGLVFTPAADIRIVGREDGVDQGWTASAGTGVEIPLGGGVFVPTARLRYGNLTVRSGVESGFTGFEIGGVMRTRRVP